MLRRVLLTMLASAAMAGCATDYNYRGGNGDYYYGQPRVEYRDVGPGGYYSGFGLGYGYNSYGYGSYGYARQGFGGTYYYDRFGRLVYGYPSGYYGSAYYGGNGWYGPRSHHEHGNQTDQHGDVGNHDRPAPWRDLDGFRQRDEDGNRQRPLRQPRPDAYSQAPVRQQSLAPTAPITRQRSESSSRMGSFIGGVARPQGKRNAPPEE